MAGTRRFAAFFALACLACVVTAVYFVLVYGRHAKLLKLEVVSPAGLSDLALPARPSPDISGADTGTTGSLAVGPAGASASGGATLAPPETLPADPALPGVVTTGDSASPPPVIALPGLAMPGAAQYADVPSPGETELPVLAALPPAPSALPAVAPPEAGRDPAPGSGRGAVFSLPSVVPGEARRGGLTILQIGDSHTAADFFTGEVRQLMQARFGDGGIGYLNAGKPHPGVRSALVKVNASPGWTYSALQKTSDTDQFYLSGFNASVSGSGESLAFAASQPAPFDVIEVEAIFGPGRGGVSIAIDDLPPVVHGLDGPQTEKRVFRVTPSQGAPYDFRRMTITTTGSGPVTIASVGVFNHSYGVSYSAIGFPGATVDIINQINSRLFGEELRRLDPQLVVLAFGTNEGFNDNLDIGRYSERYRMVLKKIRENLPRARVVLMAPPNANRLPGRCRAEGASASCKPKGSEEQGCFWSTPPVLDKVRDVQRQIARQENFLFWNWAEVTPGDCGAHALVNASPRLMTPDHVHFTGDGYKAGARAFAKFLIPVVEQMRLGGDAVSNR